MTSKTDVLNGLLEKAQFFISNSQKLDNATIYAVRKLAVSLRKSADPNEVMSMYSRVMDLQILALKTINNIVDKFPVELTIQELHMLELFRKMPEYERQQFIQILSNSKDMETDNDTEREQQ